MESRHTTHTLTVVSLLCSLINLSASATVEGGGRDIDG